MEIVRFLSGGLNTDDSVEVMPPEDYYLAENIANGKTYDGRTGVKENILGTTSISVSSQHVDINSVPIGVIRSNKDDLNFIFYWHHDSDKYCIIKLENGVTSLVLKWSGLNFQRDKRYRINGGGIAGNLLYFTDNYNEPKCVHITRYSGGGTPTTEEEILLIKRGPQVAPSSVGTTTGLASSVSKKQWQFACQYVYFDGQYSVLSPFTSITKKVSASHSYDAITVGYPSETAPRLVKERKLFARENNTGNWYEIGSVSRSTIGGSWSSSSVSFKGNISGAPLETIYHKAFELSPRIAKCMTISSNRLWLANYNDGYDKYSASNITLNSVGIVSLSGSSSNTGPTISGNSRFKYGFILKDANGRSGGVITRDSFILSCGNLFSDTASDQPRYGSFGMDVTLNSLPSWASRATVVVTEDLIKSDYTESRSSALYYSNGSDTSTWSLSPTSRNNIQIVDNTFFTKNRGYLPQRGDVVSFTIGGSEHNLTVESYEVSGSGGIGANITCSFKNLGTFGSFEQRHFQVYRPREVSSDLLFYELSASYPISSSSLNIINAQLAPSTFELAGNGFCYRQPFLQEYDTWNTRNGKPYIETRTDGVDKKLYFKHSSAFLADTEINGLSEFNVGDEGQVSNDAGEIQKLIQTVRDSTESTTLLAICNSDTYSVYVGEAQLSTSEGSGFIVGSPNIIGDTRRQQAGYGTLHPESVIEKDGFVYWYDHLAKSYVRYATNGIFPISDYKMIRAFENIASKVTSSEVVLSGYDPFYRQIIMSAPDVQFISNETFQTSISGWANADSGQNWSWDATWESAIASLSTGSPASKNFVQTFSLKPVGAYKSRLRLFRIGDSTVNVTVQLFNGSTLIQELHNVNVNWTDADANVQIVSFTALGAFDRVKIQADQTSGTSGAIYIGSYELSTVRDIKPLSFSPDRNRWISNFGFNPLGYVEDSDYMVTLTDQSGYFLSKHNSTTFNSVYGSTLTSKIGVSFNDAPADLKDWKVMQLQGSFALMLFTGGEEVISDTTLKLTATNERGQSTTVLHDEFEVDEDLIYGTLMNDENSSGGLLEGDPIYSNTLQCTLEWGGTTHKWIKFMKAGFQPSRGHSL